MQVRAPNPGEQQRLSGHVFAQWLSIVYMTFAQARPSSYLYLSLSQEPALATKRTSAVLSGQVLFAEQHLNAYRIMLQPIPFQDSLRPNEPICVKRAHCKSCRNNLAVAEPCQLNCMPRQMFHTADGLAARAGQRDERRVGVG